MAQTDSETFSEKATDHALHPRNNGPLQDGNGHGRVTGPCGDTMEFWLSVVDGIVERVGFATDGCGSSHACGSAAACLAEGKPLRDIAAISQQDIITFLDGLPRESEHCALLAANTLKAACENHLRAAADPQSAGNGQACDGCSGEGAGCDHDGQAAEQAKHRELQERISRIGSKIIVISGKGGVGKSTVAVNLATALSMSGKRVGLLDVDIHGPSIPTMLGIQTQAVESGRDGIIPEDVAGLKVISLGLFLNDQDDAVIWRGPMKAKVIGQFLSDVAWGDLDYLIIDSPPGTGDEPLSVCQLIEDLDGAVIVTTPQKVAEVDVRKTVTFCRRLRVPVLGVVENMSGFRCPDCGSVTPILRSGAGQRIAADMEVPFLGAIPIDPGIAESGDEGQPFVRASATSETAEIMRQVTKQIDTTGGKMAATSPIGEETRTEKVAIPMENGVLAAHFGHCKQFATVDVEGQKQLKREDVDAPPHEPGLLPKWLGERGVNTILAGGMGQRALTLFAEQGIKVVVGVPSEPVEDIVNAYLEGALKAGENVCDH